jgi:hypothetical protein
MPRSVLQQGNSKRANYYEYGKMGENSSRGGPRLIVFVNCRTAGQSLHSFHSCLSTNELTLAFSIVQSGGIQHAPRQVVRQVVRRPRPSWVCMAEDGDGNPQKVKEKKKEDFSGKKVPRSLSGLDRCEVTWGAYLIQYQSSAVGQSLPSMSREQSDLCTYQLHESYNVLLISALALARCFVDYAHEGPKKPDDQEGDKCCHFTHT